MTTEAPTSASLNQPGATRAGLGLLAPAGATRQIRTSATATATADGVVLGVRVCARACVRVCVPACVRASEPGSGERGAVAQHAPQDLAGRGLGDLLDQLDRANPLVRGDLG